MTLAPFIRISNSCAACAFAVSGRPSPVAHSMDELVPRGVKMAACRRSTSCLLYFIDIELAKLRGATVVLLPLRLLPQRYSLHRSKWNIYYNLCAFDWMRKWWSNDAQRTRSEPQKKLWQRDGERNKKENATQPNTVNEHSARRWRHTHKPNLAFAHNTEWRVSAPELLKLLLRIFSFIFLHFFPLNASKSCVCVSELNNR